MGRFDDARYVAEVTKEFKKEEPKPKISDELFKDHKKWTEANIKAVKAKYQLTQEQLKQLA